MFWTVLKEGIPTIREYHLTSNAILKTIEAYKREGEGGNPCGLHAAIIRFSCVMNVHSTGKNNNSP